MEENSKISVKDIAKLSNVSIGTVDRVIHNRKGVSATTRKLVQEIIDQTGYKRNIIASRLASKKTIRIVTLLPAGSNRFDYWKLHHEGLEKAHAQLVDLGLELRYFHFQMLNPITFSGQWEIIKEMAFDGLITVPIFENLMEEVVEFCDAEEKTLVFVDAMSEKFPEINYIGQNAFKAGKVCARLMSKITPSNSKLLLVNISRGDKVHINNLQRDQGFKAYYKDNALENEIYSVSNPLENRDDFTRELKKIVNKKGVIHGILVTNSRSFFVVDALESLELTAIKVIGFDLNEKNVNELKNEKIQFLIDQKPGLQSEQAIDAVFRSVAYGVKDSLGHIMPVEIIVKENLG